MDSQLHWAPKIGPAPRAKPIRKTHRLEARPPFQCVSLVLQGGGALGAYQAGVYQALAEADLHPDWIAGISIGAINAALIAGNPPEKRVERLRQFWEAVTTASPIGWFNDAAAAFVRGEMVRQAFNFASACRALVGGVPGFFAPHVPGPWLRPRGTLEALGYYTTRQLRATLEELVDFDRINAGPGRFSVGAVNVRTGNFVYFDTKTHHITVDHVMASGALPPGFPPVEIDGEFYWDGGLVSNTPLQWVVDNDTRHDNLIFQIDLWNARGDTPADMPDVLARQKAIQYSSRTRAQTDQFKRMQTLRRGLASYLDKLPESYRQGPEFEYLRQFADQTCYNVVHLIYQAQKYEGQAKDYEFSRLSMADHWQVGYNDAVRTLRHPEVLERHETVEGIFTFDLARDSRD